MSVPLNFIRTARYEVRAIAAGWAVYRVKLTSPGIVDLVGTCPTKDEATKEAEFWDAAERDKNRNR